MRAYRYQENYAEQWLHAARDKVIDSIERLTEQREVGRWEYFSLVLSVKIRCVGAIFIAIGAGIGAMARAIGLSVANFILHKGAEMQVEESWADVQESVDLILSAFSALFDSESVLSAADRGNIRRIHSLGKSLQDVANLPTIKPATKKELETWYRNAKVFVRKGGEKAKTEMTTLANALEQIRKTPDVDHEKLLTYRWEPKDTGSVEIEKIRGIRWKKVIPAVTNAESLNKRTWKKKAS